MNNAKQRKKIFKVSITSPMKSFITKTLQRLSCKELISTKLKFKHINKGHRKALQALLGKIKYLT